MEYAILFLPLAGSIIGYFGRSLTKFFSEITTSLFVTLSDILMVVDSGKISKGNELQNVAVSATVVKQTRGPKIITLKHRRRKNSRRVKGHRQDLTLLKVVGIGDPKKLVIKDEKKVTKEKVQKAKKADETKVTKKETKSKVNKASTAKDV